MEEIRFSEMKNGFGECRNFKFDISFRNIAFRLFEMQYPFGDFLGDINKKIKYKKILTLKYTPLYETKPIVKFLCAAMFS